MTRPIRVPIRILSILTLSHLFGCSAGALGVHADLAQTLEEVVQKERRAYRADRKDMMRTAGANAAPDELEEAVRAAGARFDDEHRPWRDAIAGLAIAKGTYATAALASEDGADVSIARGLREALKAYRELRRLRPALPEISEEQLEAVVGLLGSFWEMATGEEENGDE